MLTAPPGLGRTALLRRAAAHYLRGHGGPVLYASAAPTEQRLPYSGLHALLCSAPGPLPLAPDTVLSSGISPGALLGLLRALGAEQPLLVCVDDAHLWDPDSRAALGFAARRLGAGSRVAVVIGAADETAFAGLPALRLGPLDDDAATALLDRLTDGAADVDPVVRSELLREAAGNPRLLAGLAGRLTPASWRDGPRCRTRCPAARASSTPTPPTWTGCPVTPTPCSCWPRRRRSTSRTGRAPTRPCCCGRGSAPDSPPPTSTGCSSRRPAARGHSSARGAGSTSATRCCAARSCTGHPRPPPRRARTARRTARRR